MVRIPVCSILGPTLFLLYINDLPDGMISKLVMYADDTTLFNSSERQKVNPQQRQQLCDALNKDLQTISDWGSQWLVAFNSSKTQSFLHSRLKGDNAPPCLQMSNSNLQEKDAISFL
ncbi:MAG: reverse transcriptase domain-containing protein, partial [Pseudomonadota bacterium]